MDFIEDLRSQMKDSRFKHTLGVAQTAVKLAKLYGADCEAAEKAGLLHDIARNITDQKLILMCRQFNLVIDEIERATPSLLHGKVGAEMAQERYGIRDTAILDAIRFHTTGRKKMSTLDKIIFAADMIEPLRKFPGVENLRELAGHQLDGVVLEGLNSTLRYVLKKGLLIHPHSIEARNWLIMEQERSALGGTQ